MGDKLTFRFLAVVSFLTALYTSEASLTASIVMVFCAAAGFGLTAGFASNSKILLNRIPLGPWILGAATALSLTDSMIGYSLAVVVGAGLVGGSLVDYVRCARMVPTVGVGLVFNHAMLRDKLEVSELMVWAATVVLFTVVTHYLVPPVLDHVQPAQHPKHTPPKAQYRLSSGLLAIGVAALFGFGVAQYAPMPSDGRFAFPTVGDLGGTRAQLHPARWGRLDTGNRVELGDEEVLRVRADRPDYWRGATYSSWDGRTWTNPDPARRFTWETPAVLIADDVGTGPTTTQHFTVMGSGMMTIHGAYEIETLTSTARAALIGEDGSIELEEPLGAGARWTVRSRVREVTPDSLRRADPLVLGAGLAQPYAVEDNVPDSVAQLAKEITRDAASTYDKIVAIEDWVEDNIEYSRQIDELPARADAVEQLLFVDKLGYCEQIGTALVVMARSLGIPARLVVGYVPGSYDDSTGEYVSLASDAHAWAEIYFPGIGWQGFDPTSGVPLSGEELAADQAKTSDLPTVNPIMAAMATIGLAALGAIGFVLSKFFAVRRSGVDRRMDRLNGLGAKLMREWDDSMTIAEKADQLQQAGLPEDVVIKARSALERQSYSADTNIDHGPAADTALGNLEQAVKQLVSSSR